jgi:hypothetical protein
MINPSTKAKIPKKACNQIKDNWTSDKLLINIKFPMKTGIIMEIIVARLKPTAAMLRKNRALRGFYF